MGSGKDFILDTTVCPVRVSLGTLYRMALAVKSGGRVVWNYQGLRREIPAAVIENAVQLAEDYDSRSAVPNLDSAPRYALHLTWEQTVPLSRETRQLGDKGPEAAAGDGSPAEQ